MKKIGLLTTLLFLNLHAELVDLAHNAKFYKCDSAINQEFKYYLKSSNGESKSYFFNKDGTTFAILATWGAQGDGIMEHTVFEKHGSSCNAYQTATIITNKSCIAWKEENPAWSYVRSVSDFTWTVNKGGIDSILTNLPNGGCSINFNSNTIYPIDK